MIVLSISISPEVQKRKKKIHCPVLILGIKMYLPYKNIQAVFIKAAGKATDGFRYLHINASRDADICALVCCSDNRNNPVPKKYRQNIKLCIQ